MGTVEQYRANAEGFIEAIQKAKTLTIRSGQFADSVAWTIPIDELPEYFVADIVRAVRADLARFEEANWDDRSATRERRGAWVEP